PVSLPVHVVSFDLAGPLAQFQFLCYWLGVRGDASASPTRRSSDLHAQVGAGQAPARRRGGQRAHAAFPPAARVMSWATTTGTTWPCAASMAAMMLARLRRRSGNPLGSWPS